MPDIEWKGVDQWIATVDAWIDRTEAATTDALVDIEHIVHDQTAAEFNTGTGPTSRSGALAGAVVMGEARRIGDSGLEVTYGPAGLVYIRRVELGHRAPHSAGPHPFFAPGWAHSIDQIGHVLVDRWRTAQPH